MTDSALLNAMDPWMESSVNAGVFRGPITTVQPNGLILRHPQRSKYFAFINQFLPLTAGALGVIDQFQIDGDADFWIFKQAVLAVDAASGAQQRDDTIQFAVSPVSEAYNFIPMFLANWGSGRFPNVNTPPIKVPRNAVWQATANSRNAAGTNTNINVAHHGCKMYQQPIVSARTYNAQKFFSYPISFTNTDGGAGTVPAGQTSISVLRIDGISDFDVRRITCVSDAPITIQIKSDDDNWFQRPIRSELIGGSQIAQPGGGTTQFSGELPFWLPSPRFITRAGYINVQVSNLDLANPNRVQIVFHGNRLYPGGGLR